jgi:anthranilate 1,2-dioxygenase small subunit
MNASQQATRDFETAFLVTRTIAGSARAIDDDRLEDWPDFFTEDAVYRIMPRENLEANRPIAIIYCRGIGMLRDRVLAIRKASVFGPQCCRHVLSTTTLEDIHGGAIRASTPFLVVRTKLDSIERGTSEMFAAGEYRDVLEFQSDDSLKLRERIVVLDTSLIATQLVMPL